MKSTWFIVLLSVSMVCNMQAQLAPNLTNAAPGLELSLSESNALVRSKVETLSKPIQAVDPASVIMRAQQTNQASPMGAQPAIVTDASSARRKPAIPEEIEFLAEGVVARFGPHRVDFPLLATSP